MLKLFPKRFYLFYLFLIENLKILMFSMNDIY